MPLIKSSVTRQIDPSGDEIKTFQESDGKELQAIALVETIGVNNILEETSSLMYIGREEVDGTWHVQEIIHNSTGTAVGWATEINNPAYTSYTGAWGNHGTLSYGLYSEGF